MAKFDDANDTKIKKKRTKIVIFSIYLLIFPNKKRTIFNKIKMPKSARKTVIRALREFAFFAREQKS